MYVTAQMQTAKTNELRPRRVNHLLLHTKFKSRRTNNEHVLQRQLKTIAEQR